MRRFGIGGSILFVLSGCAVVRAKPSGCPNPIDGSRRLPTGRRDEIGFKGTELMPHAGGSATVKVKGGYTEIKATFLQLLPARKFGAEFLTYVLWAVSPEGRAVNLGEVLINSAGDGRLKVSSPMQTFSLLVTAEPYFGVRIPSELLVLENEILRETKGKRFAVHRVFADEDRTLSEAREPALPVDGPAKPASGHIRSPERARDRAKQRGRSIRARNLWQSRREPEDGGEPSAIQRR